MLALAHCEKYIALSLAGLMSSRKSRTGKGAVKFSSRRDYIAHYHHTVNTLSIFSEQIIKQSLSKRVYVEEL